MDRWQESFNRFKHIFGLNAQGKYADKEVYYIPGNHDIGYETLHYAKPEVFSTCFSSTFIVEVAKG
jgi:metallophosphoesterase superfamily enzyme